MITVEEKNELEQVLCSKLKNIKIKTSENGDSTYKVPFVGGDFLVEVSNQELAKAVNIAIKMLEELDSLANSEYNREAMEELCNKANKEASAIKTVLIYESIQNDNLKKLTIEAAEVMRVGGAYWMFVVRPSLSTSLFFALNEMIHCFDDEDMHNRIAYFLVGSILSMQRVPIDQEDDADGKLNK
ncbi:hypothetical protein SAMN04487829_0011 [Pseudobutyrivibrio sp. NOR37]|uniref:Uncharacterized protein n=1 Tax=Pseudobutyrivibrio xylanivorans TaxID=185007 RepID=A0A6M0LD11_PSEXY|nr:MULTISPECIES: hypothetical protein [Pseudobutyrivibrio]NEX00444.1 hypothetical protein [Pseudobutyrivibrio xylanivorans]SFR59643.1 hypothetical protein SAMN04487829_0011 [Pseudobutyrivibrio sp. NOR37]